MTSIYSTTAAQASPWATRSDVKARLSIAGTNNEDGIARWLKEHLL